MFLSSEELSCSCRWMGVESTESSNYIDFKGGNFWWRKTYLMVHDAWPCVHNMTFAAQYHFSCKVPDESSGVVPNSSWLFLRYVPIEMNLLQLKRNSKYAKIKLESKDNEHVALSSDAGNWLALEHTILVIQPYNLELLSAAPWETLTLLSCSQKFPLAPITHAKHEPNLR